MASGAWPCSARSPSAVMPRRHGPRRRMGRQIRSAEDTVGQGAAGGHRDERGIRRVAQWARREIGRPVLEAGAPIGERVKIGAAG
jgi:hypothetical protein